jgi:hypothetical protein
VCSPLLADRSKLDGLPAGTATDRAQVLLEQMSADLQARQASFNEAASRARDEVDELWASSKLDIVPGDYLLDRVCTEFGVRYRKERDGARLASLIPVESVAPEIAVILRAICN